MTPPLEFIKANIYGNLVDDQNPNRAWPPGLEYDDSSNDRWRFSYGKLKDSYENDRPLGWTRVGYLDISLPQFLNNNPILGNILQQDLTPLFTHMGYEITEYIAHVLSDSFVVPIKNGFVFVHKLSKTTSTIFIPDTDRRLDDIIRIRNKQIEMVMRGGESMQDMLRESGLGMSVTLISLDDLMSLGGFRF